MKTSMGILALTTLVGPLSAQAPMAAQAPPFEPPAVDEVPLLPGALLHYLPDGEQPIHLEATFSPDGRAQSVKVILAPTERKEEFQAWGMDWRVRALRLNGSPQCMKGQIFIRWSAKEMPPQWKFEYDLGGSHEVSTTWSPLSIRGGVIVEMPMGGKGR